MYINEKNKADFWDDMYVEVLLDRIFGFEYAYTWLISSTWLHTATNNEKIELKKMTKFN